MISENEIVLNTIQSYDDYYGIDNNQTILLNVALEQGYFKGRDVESCLNIFLFERFDDEECYHDEKQEYVNGEYVRSHPQLVEKLIEENYKYY